MPCHVPEQVVQAITVVGEGNIFVPRCGSTSVSRAWYGVCGNEWTDHLGYEVSRQVLAMLAQGQEVVANNSNFGDPAPFRRKILVVMETSQQIMDSDGGPISGAAVEGGSVSWA